MLVPILLLAELFALLFVLVLTGERVDSLKMIGLLVLMIPGEVVLVLPTDALGWVTLGLDLVIELRVDAELELLDRPRPEPIEPPIRDVRGELILALVVGRLIDMLLRELEPTERLPRLLWDLPMPVEPDLIDVDGIVLLIDGED